MIVRLQYQSELEDMVFRTLLIPGMAIFDEILHVHKLFFIVRSLYIVLREKQSCYFNALIFIRDFAKSSYQSFLAFTPIMV